MDKYYGQKTAGVQKSRAIATEPEIELNGFETPQPS
jgi:hypothetical protein